jgi:hypothetical protein
MMPKVSYNVVEFEVPNGWIDMSVVTLVAPEATRFRANVVVSRDPLNGASIEAYAEAQTKEFRKQVRRYIVHKEEAITVSGRPARLVEQSFQSPENVMVRQIQVYVPVGELALTLSLTHGEDEFETMRPDFEKTIRSFALTAG